VFVGNIDPMLAYDGDALMGLENPFERGGWCSGIMSWRAGQFGEIWDKYMRAGRPDDTVYPEGDQQLIAKVVHNRGFWQHEFPGFFESYKALRGAPPLQDTRVVYFHGYPKPEDVDDHWMKMAWADEPMSEALVKAYCNTVDEKLSENKKFAYMLGLPTFDVAKAHDKKVCIVAGGPSLKTTIDDVIKFHGQGNCEIWAMNGSAKFLQERGVIPDVHVIVDARPDNVDFVDGSKAKRFLVASQCDRAVFRRLSSANVTMYELDAIGNVGSTVGLISIALAGLSGFRVIHVYGMDSCYIAGDGHAYEQRLNDGDKIRDARLVVNGQEITYFGAAWMFRQVQEFLPLANDLAEVGCEISIHGKGLLRDWVAAQTNQPINSGVAA